MLAYIVRFQALAYFAVEARMARLDPALDDAAQSLGADRTGVLADVHLPLLWPGIVTAALLVFVEVMKELPATALLRPLGNDTLAIAVWEATKDSRFDTAALPALLIVAVGLVPVVLMIRLSRRGSALEGDLVPPANYSRRILPAEREERAQRAGRLSRRWRRSRSRSRSSRHGRRRPHGPARTTACCRWRPGCAAGTRRPCSRR